MVRTFKGAALTSAAATLLAAGALFGALSVGPSLARAEAALTPGPNAQRGLAIARQACAQCHLLSDGTSDQVVPAGIPSLRAIANARKQTAATIRGALLVPSHPMPDTGLTSAQILDVIAYLNTLREEGAEPLLPEPASGDTEKAPAPA